MLKITSGPIVSKSISISKSSAIKRVSSSYVVDEVNIIGKANIRFLQFEIGFLISKVRLAFVKLKQAFIKAPILHNFDSKYHI